MGQTKARRPRGESFLDGVRRAVQEVAQCPVLWKLLT